MYGMQQQNYSLLYYTHLNTPDSINTHSCQTSSPRTAEHRQRLYGGFHLNWLTFGYTALLAITTALITFIRCSHAWVRCKNRHFDLVQGQSFVLNLPCDSLKEQTQNKNQLSGAHLLTVGFEREVGFLKKGKCLVNTTGRPSSVATVHISLTFRQGKHSEPRNHQATTSSKISGQIGLGS